MKKSDYQQILGCLVVEGHTDLAEAIVSKSSVVISGMENDRAVESFLSDYPKLGSFGHVSIRKGNKGIFLIDYDTAIGYKKGNKVYMNISKYSTTTSKLQSTLKAKNKNIKQLSGNDFEKMLIQEGESTE